MAPNQMMIVSGSPASVAELDKGESWLKDWLAEEPSRLGIGDVSVLPGDPVQGEDGNPAFLASDATRYFSVNVNLGELDASHGFHVLDSWARNRVRHPDKTHVAVLVTENVGDRYQTALRALSEHLPLVVVELQAWRGKTEVIVVPRVVLASQDLRLPKAAPVRATPVAEVNAPEAPVAAPRPVTAEKAEPSGQKPPESEVADPWKLPKREAAPVGVNGAAQTSGS